MLKKSKTIPYFNRYRSWRGPALIFFTRDAMTRFETLKKPPLAPPGSVFPIVWSVLFVLMGISIVLFLKSGGIDKRLASYYIPPSWLSIFLDLFFSSIWSGASSPSFWLLLFVRTGNRNDRKILKGF